MKKIVFTLAIMLVSTLSASAHQQTSEYKAELVNYLNRSSSLSIYEQVIDQLISVGGVSASKTAEIREKVLPQAMDRLIDLVMPLYSSSLTIDELKEINAFLNTEVGLKMSEMNVKLFEEAQVIGVEWAGDVLMLIQDANK